MAKTSSRFRSRRRPGTAAALLVSLCAAACSSGSAAPQPQQLTLWSGIAAEFTNDLIQRFNSALPQTHIDLQTTSGGVVVVSAVDGGQGQLGLAQSDVVYLAYRRGIERNLYPHKNLRAIAVLWVNTLYVLVRRDSPFRSIKDLKGRRVGIILPGTSGEFSTRIVLGAHGMSYADVQPIFEPTDRLVPKLGLGRDRRGVQREPAHAGRGPRAQRDRPAPPAADRPHRDQPAARQQAERDGLAELAGRGQHHRVRAEHRVDLTRAELRHEVVGGLEGRLHVGVAHAVGAEHDPCRELPDVPGRMMPTRRPFRIGDRTVGAVGRTRT